MKFITAIYIVIIYKAIKRNGFDITIDFCCKWKPNMPKRNRSIPLVCCCGYLFFKNVN